MRRQPTSNKHRIWMDQLMGFTGRWGLAMALLLSAPLLYLAWIEQLRLLAVLAGGLCGILSYAAGKHYHQGADASYWMLMWACAFAGWPLLQLYKQGELNQWEQGMLTLQYFAVMAAIWCLLACFRGRQGPNP